MKNLLIFILTMGVSMFGFAKDFKVIGVEFYDGESSTPFAASDIPIEQLPDTFEIDTTINMGENDWRIIDAKPLEKTEFKKGGKLKLYLTKVETTMVDPNELLYSLPTINDSLAGVENTESLENVAVVREDDWRQFEFIAKHHELLIQGEFEAIQKIYENHREGQGFNQLHVRQAILEPLSNTKITINSLKDSFSIENNYAGVAFNNAAATIVNGFAFSTKSGWLLWGQLDKDGRIAVLNLSETENSSVEEINQSINSFTQKYELSLVNWPRLFWGGVGQNKFIEYKN